MEKSNKTLFIAIGLIAVIVFLVVFGVVSLTQNIGKNKDVVDTENALKTLDRLCSKITINNIEPRKDSVDLDAPSLNSSLPDISTYPLGVTATTSDSIEIFSSPEKAGPGTDGWLIEIANAFNKSGATVNGKPVSVSVRNIASGTGVDYISSGKYVPDVFSPSNELWGEMLKDRAVKVNLAESRLAGNVPGILLSKSKYNELVKKYGSINSKSVVESVANGELAMGYTNPFASSTGLNFLLTTLYTFNPNDPLGENAANEFQKFQNNIPFLAFTTMQMRDSAKSGALDGFVLEYQSFENTPDLKSAYVFTPFGVRHDNPVYEIGELSAEKKEILRKFIDFCKTEESQKKATQYGFNRLDDYVYEFAKADGRTISEAQTLWKKNKSGTSGVAAVFVADISGSMDGAAILKLKESLLAGSKYISSENSIGLVSFSDNVNINLPIGKFDLNQRAYFSGAVKDLKAGGATAMFDAIAVASKMLLEEKAKNPDVKLMLFVLTDGETNRGHSLADIEKTLKNMQIPIYTIGYNANLSVLENISKMNEAANINAETEDVVYKLESLFNAQM